jgi:catechol 2,3-dioxygenase-like lactoylglutathione lyase family enzyme
MPDSVVCRYQPCNPSMRQRIAHIALVVADYDEAIRFYTEKLDFRLVEDTPLGEDKRWVVVAPPGAAECSLLLAKAANDQQRTSIGNQTGGRVFLFLFTDNFRRDYENMLRKGIHFIRPPQEEAYGMVAVFEDLYGNLWDLLEPSERNRGLLKEEPSQA